MKFIIKNTIETTDFVDIRSDLNWNFIPHDLVERALSGSMINISVFDKNMTFFTWISFSQSNWIESNVYFLFCSLNFIIKYTNITMRS